MLILLARAAGPIRAGRVMGLMGVVLRLGPIVGPIAGGAVLRMPLALPNSLTHVGIIVA